MTKNAAFIEPPVTAPAVALRDVRKVHGQGDGAVVALDGVSVELAPRVVHRDHGPVGLGQEHVPARGGGARPADVRHRRARRHRAREAQRAAADDPAARADRVRLPGLQPDALAHGHPEHRAAAAPGRSPPAALGGARGRRAGRAREAPAPPSRPSSPAASSSASRSPGRSSPGPRCVFADEPTGALDTRTGRGVLALLREVVDADGHTVVMVTHDPVGGGARRPRHPARRRPDRRDARRAQRRRGRRAARAPGGLSHASSRPPQRPRPPRHVRRRPRRAVRLVRARDGRRHAARVGAAHPSAGRALRRRGGRRRPGSRSSAPTTTSRSASAPA